MPPRSLPINRKTTAYDKSALRVRIDGRKVSTVESELSRTQATSDAEALPTKPLIRTKRKDWIAPDVYGFERIRRRRDYALHNGDEDEGDLQRKSKKRTRPEPKSYNGKRRRLNNSDLSFISNPYASYPAVSDPSTNLDPSTDLLKTIHRFASEFYDASGQLVNATRSVFSRKRRMDVQQSEEPDSNGEKSAEDDDEGTGADGDHQEDDSESDSYKPDQSSNSEDDALNTLVLKKTKLRHYRIKQRRLQKVQEDKDMYTAFDGSALFCIGMLFKAHIISQLESSIPESWDGEVAAYTELEKDLHFHDSDKESEGEKEGEKEDSDGVDAEKLDNRKEKLGRWENQTLSSPGRIDDLRVDFLSPEYSRL